MAVKQITAIRNNIASHWVGDGFPVRTMFSYNDSGVDPFLLLDYAEPYKFAPSRARPGVGEHPHKGFETVTIVWQGELEHRDSAGNHGVIGPGDVQWMTAASGVVHEEFHSERFAREGGLFEVAQLWVNLPAAAKKEGPRYQEIRADAIPMVENEHYRSQVRVIAGTFNRATGPARTVTPILLWEIILPDGDNGIAVPIPTGYTAMLLVRRNGDFQVNEGRDEKGVRAKGVCLVEFERDGDEIILTGGGSGLLLAGEPIGEAVVGQGPFVMNTREEIGQAYREYQSGAMGHIH
jgi:redox-sensitive bicupin YhaK (pirin superfamily)